MKRAARQDAAPAPAPSSQVTYGELTSSASWTAVDLSPTLGTTTYSGMVFDGRYMYFAPDGSSGAALRYDSKSPFDAPRSWSTFDLTSVNPNARAYRGAAFDGRYVYFVPSGGGGILARFDTAGRFLDGASWTLFDLHAVDSSIGFNGAVFDGRWLYLVPAGWNATTFRYDTQGAFSQASSWSKFEIASVDANARGFVGAVFDGRHVYFVPSGDGTGPRRVIARLDTYTPFTQAGSWTTLDLTGLNPKAFGYRTGAFDGRYLYLVPGWSAPTPSWVTSTMARYDTRAAFTKESSWAFFDTTSVNASAAGFNGAAFDGRYLILAPGYNGAYHGVSLRYDTQGSDFAGAGAWSTFDAATLGPWVKNLRGAAFDGKHVYFAPVSGVAVRYDARTPALAPDLLTAGGSSFY
jgi:hypothetical protein